MSFTKHRYLKRSHTLFTIVQCVLTLLFSGISVGCSALGDSASFFHLNSSNGLPSDHIYSTIKDHLGYMWMATDNGVVKYNGYTIKIFNTGDGLPSNDVWRVYEDRVGRVWLFSNAENIGYILGDVYYPVRLSESWNAIYPRDVAETERGLFFLYTEHAANNYAIIQGNKVSVIKYDDLKSRFSVRGLHLACDGSFFSIIYEAAAIYGNISSRRLFNRIRCTPGVDIWPFLSHNNVIFGLNECFYGYAHGDSYLSYFDPSQCRFLNIYLDSSQIDDKIVVGQAFRNKINLVTGKFLYSVKGPAPADKTRIPWPSFLVNKVIWVEPGPDGSDWYTTYNDGIWIKNRYPFMEDKIKPMPELKTAQIIGSGRSGVFWWDNFSSELIITKGLSITDRITLKGYGELRYVGEKPGDELELSFVDKYIVYDLHKRTMRDFFAESSTYLMEHYDFFNSDATVERFSAQLMNQYFRCSDGLVRVSDSCYLISLVGMVHRLSVEKGKMRAHFLIREKALGYLNDTLHRCYGVYNKRSIYLFNPEWKEIKLTTGFLRALGIYNIINIMEDHYGNYLIHSQNGIFHYNFNRGTLTRLRSNFNLYSTKSILWKDWLLVAGDFGLACTQIGDNDDIKAFKLLPKTPSLTVDRLKGFSIDSLGDIYIKTDRAAFAIPFDSLIGPSFFSFEKDTMFHFRVASPLTLVISDGDTIDIRQGTGKITLDAINYLGSKGQRFYYRIGNRKWQASSSGEIFLEDPEPGTVSSIRFYLKDAFWKSDLTTLYFYTPFRWYQTLAWRIVFWMIGTLLFGSSLVVASTVTQKRVARANEKKRWQTELELRAIHSQINPHFIFNTLATALFFISKQRSSEAYDHVSSFSKLLRGYLKSSRERLIRLSDETEMLERYIKLQNARFQNPFRHEINIDPSLELSRIMIPSLLLQPLVENAINHGLFHRGDNGRLIIEFKQGRTETELIVTIDDNGVGRDRAKQIQGKLKFSKESFGSALTSELIDVFQKYEQMDIHLEYIDKEEPETGTIVRLTIKNIKVIS